MTVSRVALARLAAAMDGRFTAIADVSRAMTAVGAAGDYRPIRGVAVVLHIERLGLDLPLRTTGDLRRSTAPPAPGRLAVRDKLVRFPNG